MCFWKLPIYSNNSSVSQPTEHVALFALNYQLMASKKSRISIYFGIAYLVISDTGVLISP